MNINESINEIINGNLPPLDAGASQDLFVFNWYSLANRTTLWSFGNMVLTVNDRDVLNIDLRTFVSWLSDGQKVSSKRLDSNQLSITMAIYWSSHADLQMRLDKFKRETQDVEADFEVNYNWEIRVWKWTIVNIRVEDFLVGVNRVNISFDMLLTSIGRSKFVTWRSKNWVTWNTLFVINNEGSYKSFPIVIIKFSDSGNTNVSQVLLRNKKLWDSTWYEVTFIKTLGDGDVVTIDYEQWDVNLNGVGSQDYDGVMTPIEIWKTSFEIEITADTTDYAVYVLYYNRRQ